MLTEMQKIPILMYHSISNHANPGFRACVVPPGEFDRHLSYLSQHHYTPVTVTQFVLATANGGSGLPLNPILLTFDDGYADFYTAALPVLQRYGFTATLYVATGFVGGTSGWVRIEEEKTRPMLTWEQLSEISASGIECGAHTHTHPRLDMLSLSAARDEIVRSKELLEDHLGKQVTSFAYPYGFYNTRLRQIVQATGFVSACAIKLAISSLHDDPYALARLAVEPGTSEQDFEKAFSTGRGPLVASPMKRVRTQIRQSVRNAYGRLWQSRSAAYQAEAVSENVATSS